MFPYAREAFQRFKNRENLVFEGSLEGSYPNLSHVPGEGRPYALRSSVFLFPGSVLRIPPALKDAAEEQFAHFAEVGLDMPDFRAQLIDDRFGQALRKHPNRDYEVFMFHDGVHALCPDERRHKATLEHERKCNLAELYGKIGLTPETVVVRGATKPSSVPALADALRDLGNGPVRFKANWSASGGVEDNRPAKTMDECLEVYQKWKARDYVIQREVGEMDVSIGYYFDRYGCYALYTTEQENSAGGVHERNFFDVEGRWSHICIKKTEWIADVMWTSGFRGFAGFDLRVTPGETPTQDKGWVIEVNARVPGSAYAWFLAQRLGAKWWCNSNLKGVVTGPTISGLIPSQLVFSKEKGYGVICHNPGPLASEKACSVTVLARTAEEGRRLLTAVQAHACGTDSQVHLLKQA